MVCLLIIIAGTTSCGGPPDSASGPRSPANSPPAISTVRVLPEQPAKESALTAFVQCDDPDGDPIKIEYEWLKNDQPISGESTSVLKNRLLNKGDIISVKVTPDDGKEKGKAVLSPAVKIVNSAPVVHDVWIEPKIPTASEPLRAMFKSEDKDGDFVFAAYHWERNGVVIAEERSPILNPERFKKGDSIAVSVEGDDRDIIGPPKKSAPVVIANSPPVITSSPPPRSEGNLYRYHVKVTDPDNDPVTFTLESGPKGMKIDATLGLIQWEIQEETKGSFTVNLVASDPEGAKSIQKYTLSVDHNVDLRSSAKISR